MKRILTLFLTLICLGLLSSTAFAVNITATAHVQNIGDMKPVTGSTVSIGTKGQALRMEAIMLKTDDPDLSIVYSGHVENYGDMKEVRDGALCGTRGESKRIEALSVRLEGKNADKYDVWYRVHAENYGDLGWAKNGEQAGTTQHAFRLENIEVKIQDKDSAAPGSTETPLIWAYDRNEGINLFLVNTYRKDLGLPFLTGDKLIHEIAQIRANELDIDFSHDRPNGESVGYMLAKARPDIFMIGYQMGENIHSDGGGATPEEAYKSLYRSDGHRAQMEYPEYRYFSFNISPSGICALQWYTVPEMFQRNHSQEEVDLLMERFWKSIGYKK